MTSMTSFIGNINKNLFFPFISSTVLPPVSSAFFLDNAFLICIDAFVRFHLVLESIYTRQKVILLVGPCHLSDVFEFSSCMAVLLWAVLYQINTFIHAELFLIHLCDRSCPREGKVQGFKSHEDFGENQRVFIPRRVKFYQIISTLTSRNN